MKDTLDYYMTLRYPIEINEIPEEESGGFSARIPLLGRYSCVADGETVEEAVENLKAVKEDLLKDLLERGIAIPEPQSQKESEFSGRLLVRMPSSLHMQISEKAESRGESLNKYLVNVLSADIERDQIDYLKDLLTGISKSLEALRIQIATYRISPTITYVGVAEQVGPEMINKWLTIPNQQIPSGLAGSGFDLLSFLSDGPGSQGGGSLSARQTTNK
jgi:antitoxin HicB